MRTQKLKIVGSALVLAASIGTFSAFAHEGDGKGMGMMSGDMGGMKAMMQMMNMMSEISPEDREAMTESCMNMMQSQGLDEAEAEPEAEK